MAVRLLVYLVCDSLAVHVGKYLEANAQVPLETVLVYGRPEISQNDVEDLDVLACSLDTATAVRAMGWDGDIIGVLTREPNAGTRMRMIKLGVHHRLLFPQFRPVHTPQSSRVA